MALLFMDGFEAIGATTGPANPVTDELRRNYMVVTNSSAPDFFLRPDAESSDFCLSFGNSGLAEINTLNYNLGFDAIGKTLIIGMRFKTRDHTDGPAEHAIIQIDGNGQGIRHVALMVDYPNGRLILRRGNTLVDNSASSLLVNDTWYHIEFKIKVADSPDGVYEARLDGTNVMSGTGDTRENTDSQTIAGSVSFRGINGQNVDDVSTEYCIDDLYILDYTGVNNNNFLGADTRVRTVFPVADGTTNDFTPQTGVDNYAMVDDNPVNESDYTDGSTNGDIDEYDFDSITETTIYGAMLRADASPAVIAGGNGFRTLRARARSSATIGNGVDNIISDIQSLQEVFEVDPNTTSLWTNTNLNAAEFGVEVRD